MDRFHYIQRCALKWDISSIPAHTRMLQTSHPNKCRIQFIRISLVRFRALQMWAPSFIQSLSLTSLSCTHFIILLSITLWLIRNRFDYLRRRVETNIKLRRIVKLLHANAKFMAMFIARSYEFLQTKDAVVYGMLNRAHSLVICAPMISKSNGPNLWYFEEAIHIKLCGSVDKWYLLPLCRHVAVDVAKLLTKLTN